MESLALFVAVRLLVSFTLAVIALVQSIRYARSQTTLRAVVLWFAFAAVDLAVMAATGLIRAYILQLMLVLTAILITAMAYRARHLHQ